VSICQRAISSIWHTLVDYLIGMKLNWFKLPSWLRLSLTGVSLGYARFILKIVADYVAQGETLKEEVDWCPDEVLYWGCWHWLIINKKLNRPSAIACDSLMEIQKPWVTALAWKAPRKHDDRGVDKTREKALNGSDKMSRGLHTDLKKWPCMQDQVAVRSRCFNTYLLQSRRREQPLESRGLWRS